MLKKIAFVVLGLIAVLLVYAGFKSPDYEVSREIVIAAPAEKVFPYINNQKLAEKWGPWLEVDPNATMGYSGPDEGVGAKASWDSTGQLGTGSATITESTANQSVVIQLEYTKPFAMVQTSTYSLSPVEGGTKMQWKVVGQNNFMGRLMCLFMDMDKMVGGMFEKGLNNLKMLVESNANP